MTSPQDIKGDCMQTYRGGHCLCTMYVVTVPELQSPTSKYVLVNSLALVARVQVDEYFLVDGKIKIDFNILNKKSSHCYRKCDE